MNVIDVIELYNVIMLLICCLIELLSSRLPSDS